MLILISCVLSVCTVIMTSGPGAGAAAYAPGSVPAAAPAQSPNNVRYADRFPGGDAGAKIAACIAALPATGGLVDARGFQGAQTISSTVTVSAPAKIIFGAATFTSTAKPAFNIASNGVELEGLPEQSTLTYGAVTLNNKPLVQIANNVSDVQIHGITFNGNALGPLIGIGTVGLGGASTNDRIRITNNRFTNNAGGYVYSYAVLGSGHMTNSSVSDNDFYTVLGGIWVLDLQEVEISRNRFTNVSTWNAITTGNFDASYTSRDILIQDNRGSGMGRMAIELWGNAGTCDNATVSGNIFHGWTSVGGMGISTVNCQHTIIENNNLVFDEPGSRGCSYGVEIRNIVMVRGNHLTGWCVGIAIGSAAGSIIEGNEILDSVVMPGGGGGECCGAGILWEVPACPVSILGNTITDSQKHGIIVGRNFGCGTISNNVISRNIGYSGDATAIWNGIALARPIGPSVISGNKIIQGQASPVPGFKFNGIRFYGADFTNLAKVEGNVIVNRAPSVIGTAFFVNLPGALKGVPFNSNQTQHLDSVWNSNTEPLGESFGNSDVGSNKRTSPPGYFRKPSPR